MKRLYYVANMRLPTEKAHGYQAVKMCEAFSLHGVSVTLVVPRRHTAVGGDPFNFYGVPRSFSIVRLPIFCPFRSGFLFIALYPFFLASFAYSLFRFFRSVPIPDSCAYLRDVDLAWFLSRFSPIPVTYEMHGMNRMSHLLSGAFPRFAGVFCLTSRLRDAALSLGADPLCTIVAPDAADPHDFADLPLRADARCALDLHPSSPVVAYVGRFSTMGQDKGVRDLICAFALVPIPNSLLLLIGADPSEIFPYRAFSNRCGVSERVRIIPFLPHRSVPLYMRAADVLVMPFPRTEHYAFHMSPLKLFEYMASGTPIVATDLPSVREIVGDDSVLFVPPDDISRLADGISAVLRDPVSAHLRAVRAVSLAASHTWIARAGRILYHLALP